MHTTVRTRTVVYSTCTFYMIAQLWAGTSLAGGWLKKIEVNKLFKEGSTNFPFVLLYSNCCKALKLENIKIGYAGKITKQKNVFQCF